MITLIYSINPDNRAAEINWLRQQMIFPAVTDVHDWATNSRRVRIGVIVTSEAALTIKLRHPLEFQQEYKQR